VCVCGGTKINKRTFCPHRVCNVVYESHTVCRSSAPPHTPASSSVERDNRELKRQTGSKHPATLLHSSIQPLDNIRILVLLFLISLLVLRSK